MKPSTASKKVWQDDNVEWWYAQNILLFSRKDYLAGNPLLKEEFKNTHLSQLSIVHPRKYLELIQIRPSRFWNATVSTGGFRKIDETAIRELARLRQSGAKFLVFTWPASWWFDHYKSFHQHLVANFRCVLRNDRLVAFNLQS
jgi:hypothetical protein